MTDSSSTTSAPDLTTQIALYSAEHNLLPRGGGLVVGVSGGPDSLCLLHVLKRLASRFDLELYAAHLNHQIRGQAADEDAAYVAELCRAWGIAYTVGVKDVPALAVAAKRSLEETARHERYAFLAQVARKQGCRRIAVAHHADDQVETVLMHFMRGAGLGGLRGMLPLAQLEGHAGVALIRPLLATSRQAIVAYCAQQGIIARFDDTNLDTTYFRNRLRHELLPMLESYNPNIRQVIQHSAQAIAGDWEVLELTLDHAWTQVVRHADEQSITLDLARMRALPVGLQRSVLRRSIQQLRTSLRDIGWVHVHDAVKVLQQGVTGDQAVLPAGLRLTLSYDVAWLGNQELLPPAQGPQINGPLPLTLPGRISLSQGGWRLEGERIARQALPADWRTNRDPLLAYVDADRLIEPLALRGRQEGDTFVPLGQCQEQSLRRYMINAKIPSQQRAQVPLLTSAGQIVWVVGWRLDARYAVQADTQQVMMLRCTPCSEHDEREP